MDEALKRATAYEKAGADAILIHSKQETADQESSGTGMRRTPTRRRVGGTSPTGGNANGTRNGRTTPKPPALRTSTESKPDTAEAVRVGTPERRRSWRDRLGLNTNDE